MAADEEAPFQDAFPGFVDHAPQVWTGLSADARSVAASLRHDVLAAKGGTFVTSRITRPGIDGFLEALYQSGGAKAQRDWGSPPPSSDEDESDTSD